jgi:6-pyruvoyl-tetrahydropterin synthase-like protein
VIPASQHPPALQRPSLASWGALAAAAVLFGWPLLWSPVLPRGSDVSFHTQWSRGFAQALGEGVPYPRWIADANFGYGAPVFLMYPPASYYAVAAAQLVTGDLLEALRWVLLVSGFLAGLSFFVAARPVTSELGAAAGAVLYILLPYHALDLYDRFALGEFVAFVWFPLLFAAVRRLSDGPSPRAVLLLALSYAGLVLTHLVTAFMALFTLGPYALWRLHRARRWDRLVPILLGGAAGLLLSGAFLVPMLVARPRVYVGGMVEEWFDWWRNFVYSVKVVGQFHGDPVQPWVDGSATTQGLLTLAAAALLLLRLPKASEARSEGVLHVALAAWAYFLQTRLSTPLWQTVPQLAEVQFPWRFSAFQMLAACFALSCALAPLPAAEAAAVPEKRRRRRAARQQAAGPRLAGAPLQQPLLALGLIGLASLPALYFTVRVTGARPYDFDEAVAQTDLYRYRFAKEFLPRVVGDWKEFGRSAPGGPRASLAGGGKVEELMWATHERRLRVEAPAPTRLSLRTFAYPGWQARIDGQEAPIQAGTPYGGIELEVPSGVHEVDLFFGSTWDQRLGAALSGLGAAVLIGIGLRLRRRSPSPSLATG